MEKDDYQEIKSGSSRQKQQKKPQFTYYIVGVFQLILFLALVYVLYDLDYRSELNTQMIKNINENLRKQALDDQNRDLVSKQQQSKIDALISRLEKVISEKLILENEVLELKNTAENLSKVDNDLNQKSNQNSLDIKSNLDDTQKQDNS